jgi:hypothetical protein
MKTFTIALCFIGGAIAFAHAQDTTRNRHSQEEQEPQIVNERIETRELPDAVKRALQSQDYQGWLVNTVYKAPIINSGDPESNNKAMYVVELINGGKRKTIEFNKDGKRLNEQHGGN